jgi:hypothetical protein
MSDETENPKTDEPEAELQKARSALDDTPLTADEVKEVALEVVSRVKDGVLIPVWRLGRRYLQSLEEAADSLLAEVSKDDKGKRGKK